MKLLEVSNVVKRYRNGTLANDGISLELREGEIYGLLGPNGAGKTTLVRQVLGLLRPTSGTIHMDGVDIVADPSYARRNIGALPQGEFKLGGVHVDEIIEAVGRLQGLGRREARERTDQVIAELDLGAFRSTQLLSASGGVRRLAAFAAAAVARPRLLVLDEPTNDIDPIRRQLLWAAIARLGEAGSTVLLVTHNLSEAERVIDRLAIIDHGRIVQEGTPASLRSLVTDRLRLEVTATREIAFHPALVQEPSNGSLHFLFEQADLPSVSQWLADCREEGAITDFRIGPPTLDDIYTATVRAPAGVGAA